MPRPRKRRIYFKEVCAYADFRDFAALDLTPRRQLQELHAALRGRHILANP